MAVEGCRRCCRRQAQDGGGVEAVSETDVGGSYAGLGRGTVSAAVGAASGGAHVNSPFTAECHIHVFIWAWAGEACVCVPRRAMQQCVLVMQTRQSARRPRARRGSPSEPPSVRQPREAVAVAVSLSLYLSLCLSRARAQIISPTPHSPPTLHSNMSLKSILKTPTVSTSTPLTATPVSQRQRDVAIHHANIIEQQKSVEKDVLDAIIDLLDFPTSPKADPTRPSPSDALRFEDAIMPFQPSDYDSLIEERNIAGKCGYALCPRPKRKARSTARKHFVDTAKGVEIVDKKALEVWCSDDCARRALYVKVQLNEDPAWIRQGGQGDKIELMVENKDEHYKALPLRLKTPAKSASPVKNEDEDDAAAMWAARDDALADLAIERGEKPGRLSKANKDLISEKIKERTVTTVPVPPTLPSQAAGATHMAIEGHIPGSASRPTLDGDDDDDDDDPQDWDKHLPG
jgi:hypothetical protein